MHTEDILAATGVGLWRWDNTAGVITLDATAARLLGLPPEETVLTESALRSRFHALDYAELANVGALAIAEGTIAEALQRVVAPDGTVLRVVRNRLALAERPRPEPETETEPGRSFVLYGLLTEIPWSAHPAGLGSDTSEAPLETRPAEILPARPPTTSPPVVHSSASQDPATAGWRHSREAFLMDTGRALATAQTTQEVLEVAAQMSLPGLNPVFLVIYAVRGNRLAPINYYGPEAHRQPAFGEITLESDYPGSVAVRTGRAVYLSSPDEYRRRFPAVWPLLEDYGRRAWAYLPLTVNGRTIGTWLLAFDNLVPFTSDERRLLVSVARMLAQALSRVYVRESERELADSLQRTMRPAQRTAVPGMTVVSRYLPVGGGLQVGGDWYDVIPLPSGRTALVIGDVQGHDVRAAGVMTQLRIALRAYAAEGHRPDAVLARANRFLAGMETGDLPEPGGAAERAGTDSGDDHRFATCLYVEADPAGALDVARAGHPDPALRLADGAVLTCAVAPGPPLGIVAGADYPITRVVLGRGETLLMCTDGLVEAGGLDYDAGWERLRKVLGEHGGSPEDLADTLIRAMHGAPSRHVTGTGHGMEPRAGGREDDIALMLLKREGGAPDRFPHPLARRLVMSVSQSEQVRISDARHRLRELMFDWAPEDQVEGAVLMLSELLTNALVHTDWDAALAVGLEGEPGSRRLRVEVSDSSDEPPHPRDPGELASHGRGLMLLEMLAHSWGVEPMGTGKSIWFELHEAREGPDRG
ncbi:SpoIIE family protein phosphatase [Streptomyces sp. CNQ085]|uniref:SpoIIE family protein phosphatase n=1 Tax=Streptomyces sp. CNQ085 TaxID=2886944 RepID=UPI001F50B468|nr:SpoIIE family protein phosphatase [Streptomyces sp. CNQ085]MCI0384765.1 SpoIIE family protein phosphatase [Streptomyces sp. CNQ085]